MSDRAALVYRYDGSYPGFLCCVAECFHDKVLPAQIQLLDEPQMTLCPVKAIATDGERADRVEQWIKNEISPQVREMVRRGFLTCMEHKELRLIRFILLGRRYGDKVRQQKVREEVFEIEQALRYLNNEAHRYIEFIRFQDLGEFLAAQIEPSNSVLPMIAEHFCDRFPAENLMIFDRTHSLGFLHRRGASAEFFQADSIELPPVTGEEAEYQALWKRFYERIAVEGRINPKLRMTHMPKRYWNLITELVT